MNNRKNKLAYLKKPYNKYIFSFYILCVISLGVLHYFFNFAFMESILGLFAISITALLSYVILISIENKSLKNCISNSEISYNIQDIESNIISTLGKYEIPAIIRNNGEITNFNKSAAKIVNNPNSFNDDDGYIINLKPDQSSSITIFPPPDTIDPSEGPNFILRLPAAGAIIDEKTKILSSNEAFSKLFNFKDNNENIIDVVDNKDDLELMIKNSIQEGSSTPRKFALANGSKNCLISLNKITKTKKNTFICQAIDISGFMFNEEEMAQSQKMQAVGQLAGSIAHDFNNLLTAMIGYSDILLGQYGPSEPGFNEMMQIKQNSVRAAELVKQLLAFSRKQVLNIRPVNINEIIVEIANLLQRLLGGKVKLKLNLGRYLPESDCDVTQFEQVILNIAINARDAMDFEGNLFIDTYSQKIDNDFDESKFFTPKGYGSIPNGDYVVTKIKDSGSGISHDILDKIFEPFFSTKDELSGTGLGLSTVYGIIRQLGGHIKLETKIGNGTCFYVFLKANKEKQKAKELKVFDDMEMAGKLFEKKPTVKKHKILLVEDEDAVRMFESHALKTRGYEVLEADNPISALKILEEQGGNIDLVITDVMMPEMTGPEMVEKAKLKYPQIKFLFTSGYTEDALAYFDNNDHNFLSKPFSLESLISMIEGIVNEDEK